MLRISNLADYAVVVMAAAGRMAGARFTGASIAEATGIPAPTTAKLMGLLARAGLLESARGATGGFSLARPLDAITLADIIEAVDGPIALTHCVGESACDCSIEEHCKVRSVWPQINAVVRSGLVAVSLASLAGPAHLSVEGV